MASLFSGNKTVFSALLCCCVCSLLVPDLGRNFYTQADGDNISFLFTTFVKKKFLVSMFPENCQ